MRVPDPKANTTTEAYLAYKAGFLEESELKPVLYEPYLHFDAWLAYWAGLTDIYPNNGVPIGKNLFNKKDVMQGALLDDGYIDQINYPLAGVSGFIKVEPGDTYVVSGRNQWNVVGLYTTDKKWIRRTTNNPVTIPADCYWIRVGFQWPVDLDTVQVEEGDTATAYDVFKGDPEMLCDEEALVAYLSGVTNTYPEEIKDPYDVRIVGYLRHLASIRWPEPDYPVNNEEFYLSTMEPTHTSNSEPSSDIELDTAEGKIISVEAYGDTFQQTYSGKNLLDCNTYSGKAPAADTLTGEGYVKVTQNTTSSSGGNSFAFYDIDRANLANQQVTLFAKAVSGGGSTGSRIRVTEISGSPEIVRFSPTASGGSETFTIPADGKIRIYLYINASNVTGAVGAYTEYSEVQLELGAQATSFEPYVGGVPSPNPDYPQDVQVVTGEQTINVRGVNMFNVNKPLEDKYLDNSGGWTTSTYSYVNQEYIVTGSSELSFSFAGKHGTPTIRVGEFKADGTFIKRTLVSTALTLTLDALTNKIIFSVDNLSPNYFDGLQIELGSSPTSYQPYTSQSYTVDLGSIELCKIGDYQDYIYKSGDDWYIHKETNAKAIDGTEVGWGKSGTTSNNAYYLSTSIFNDINKDGMGVGQLDTHITPTFSRYFIATSSKNIFTTDTIGLGFNAQQSPSTNIDLRIGTGLASSLDTLQLFKDWLGANRPTIYYVLATATDTKITDATLIEQLESLAGADTYNEKTYIKVTANDPNLPALLKVEAYKY